MNKTARERHRSLYTTFVIDAAVVVSICILLLMRLPDTPLATRLGLAAVVAVVNVLFALMMNVYPRLGNEEKDRKPRRRTPLVPPLPDPEGLRWVTAGAWTVAFSLMWLTILVNLARHLSTWALVIPLVILFLAMAAVDLAVNIRLCRAAGRPVTGMVLLYTLGELASCLFLFGW